MTKKNLFHDEVVTSIVHSFKKLAEPRVQGRCNHLLIDIIVIVLCGFICNLHDFVSIEEFAKTKQNWFKKFLKLPNGIPSHDTLMRVMSIIDGDEFEKIFCYWVKENNELIKHQVISFDGKTVNKTGGKYGPLHPDKMPRPLALVNVWASQNELTIGQFKAPTTGRCELAKIIEAIDLIDIKDMIVTVDAASSTTTLAKKVMEKEGDYLMPIKKNQAKLAYELNKIFSLSELSRESATTFEERGRKETRECTVINLDNKKNKILLERDLRINNFPGLKSLIFLKYIREEPKKSHTVITTNDRGECIRIHDDNCEKYITKINERYYLTSLKNSDPNFLMGKIREHWKIENSLHWRLDVLFDEDNCRVRDKKLARNMSVIRKLALNLLIQARSGKEAVTKTRVKCIFDDSFREKVLFGHV